MWEDFVKRVGNDEATRHFWHLKSTIEIDRDFVFKKKSGGWNGSFEPKKRCGYDMEDFYEIIFADPLDIFSI